MPRSPYQKLKLLYLAQYFLKNTDENHPVTIRELSTMLEEAGIAAERKSLYNDIEALRYFGFDIIQSNSTRYASYYLGTRDFELPELKLMVDSIQTAKFVTHKKTASLIKKIENLASIYDAQLLQRQVFISNRVKHMNESIYYNVDQIYNGIMKNRKIRFHYFDYTVQKERHFRKDGAYYVVSPFAMTWDDENYYLIAYDSEAERIKHYRVDKMLDIEVTDEERDGMEAYEGLDMAVYSRKVFSMFSGQDENVQLRFENHLVGVVIDRFGQDVIIVPDGPDHFTFRVDVAVSPQFFAWVAGFGASAKIIGPEQVVNEMREHIHSVAAQYD
jgi:predicted DNA-binding transcriptional regulator YafY